MDEENEDFYTAGPMEGGGYVHVFRLGGHQCILMYRNIYRAYNETPTKGPSVMSLKTQKKLIQIAAGLLFSTIIGATYKAGKQVDERIGEHFDAKIQEQQPEN